MYRNTHGSAAIENIPRGMGRYMDCGTGTMGLALTQVHSSEFGGQPRGKWTESTGYNLDPFIHVPHLLLIFTSHPHLCRHGNSYR